MNDEVVWVEVKDEVVNVYKNFHCYFFQDWQSTLKKNGTWYKQISPEHNNVIGP